MSITQKNLIIIGAAGQGRETVDIVRAVNSATEFPVFNLIGIVDDFLDEENELKLNQLAVQFLGTTASLNEYIQNNGDDLFIIIAIADPGIKKRISLQIKDLGLRFATVLHPSATLGSNVSIGEGSIVAPGCIISTNVNVGEHVLLNTAATIGHDTIVANFTTINPNATIAGGALISESVLVGSGAIVLQNLTVAENSVIGAGAVVTKSVPNNVVVKGVPGRW